MPHIHLETTADLPENADVPDILASLAAELAKVPDVKSETVKAYHSLRSVWQMGDGGPAGFAHVTLAVLAGKSPEWRRNAAERLMAVLTECFSASIEAGEVSVTLEVREMERETYQRALRP